MPYIPISEIDRATRAAHNEVSANRILRRRPQFAAGAMLTMIAAAMIPEAVLMGSGNTVGLGTLAGFLGAILFKLFE